MISFCREAWKASVSPFSVEQVNTFHHCWKAYLKDKEFLWVTKYLQLNFEWIYFLSHRESNIFIPGLDNDNSTKKPLVRCQSQCFLRWTHNINIFEAEDCITDKYLLLSWRSFHKTDMKNDFFYVTHTAMIHKVSVNLHESRIFQGIKRVLCQKKQLNGLSTQYKELHDNLRQVFTTRLSQW